MKIRAKIFEIGIKTRQILKTNSTMETKRMIDYSFIK